MVNNVTSRPSEPEQSKCRPQTSEGASRLNVRKLRLVSWVDAEGPTWACNVIALFAGFHWTMGMAPRFRTYTVAAPHCMAFQRLAPTVPGDCSGQSKVVAVFAPFRLACRWPVLLLKRQIWALRSVDLSLSQFSQLPKFSLHSRTCNDNDLSHVSHLGRCPVL